MGKEIWDRARKSEGGEIWLNYCIKFPNNNENIILKVWIFKNIVFLAHIRMKYWEDR